MIYIENKENKAFWNRNAKLHDIKMKRDHAAYEEMYFLMSKRLTKDMDVLELATGTGLIAQNIACFVKSIKATDFSQEMIN